MVSSTTKSVFSYYTSGKYSTSLKRKIYICIVSHGLNPSFFSFTVTSSLSVAYGALAHVFNDLWNSIDADIVLYVFYSVGKLIGDKVIYCIYFIYNRLIGADIIFIFC